MLIFGLSTTDFNGDEHFPSHSNLHMKYKKSNTCLDIIGSVLMFIFNIGLILFFV